VLVLFIPGNSYLVTFAVPSLQSFRGCKTLLQFLFPGAAAIKKKRERWGEEEGEKVS